MLRVVGSTAAIGTIELSQDCSITGPPFWIVNVRGTTRLTSAAIGEVLNRVCDLVIWLMSAKAEITGQTF